MTTTETAPIEIPFSMTHRKEIENIFGQAIGAGSKTRVIDSCVYLTPRWNAYQLSTGEVGIVIEKAMSSLVFKLSDYQAFTGWKNARDAQLASHPAYRHL